MDMPHGSASKRAGLRIKQNQKAWKFLQSANSAELRDLNHIALRDGRCEYTYGSLFRQWERYAAVFTALGMTELSSARVGLLGSPCAEVIFSIYGLNMTGAEVSVMASYSAFNPDRVMQTIREEKLTDFIFTDDFAQVNLLNALLAHRAELGLRNVLLLHVPMGGPTVHPMLAAAQEARYQNSKGWFAPICMDTLLAAYADQPVHYASQESSDTAFILHTSGTTGGMGKPVALSDRAFNAAVSGFWKMEELQFLFDDPVSGLIVDLSNVYGLIDQVHLPLSLGATVAVVPAGALNPGFYKAIPAFGITVLFSINAMFEHWMKLPEKTAFDFSSLRAVVLGGSAVSVKDKRRYADFLEKHGAHDVLLMNGYGVSELGGACCLSGADLEDDSLGYTLPGVELRLYDEEEKVFRSRADAPCTGVLYLNSGALATPTLDGREILKLETISRRPFVTTNDLVRLDADGKITYLGRANRYFLHEDGRKYESGRVEAEIARQSGIESCGIVPVLHKLHHDNIPMLCVKTLGGGEDAVETVRKALRQVFCVDKTLALDQLPLQVLIAEELPRNANGKIDLYAINQGQVSGQRYRVETTSFQKRVTDFRLLPLGDDAADMIQYVFQDIAADMKAKLPCHKNDNNMEENNTMKNMNPFACLNGINQMGSQMMNLLMAQLGQAGQNPAFFGMPQNMASGMQQMNQMFATMNQVNQQSCQMVQQMFNQNCQMMQQMFNQNMQMMGDFCTRLMETVPQAKAEETSETPAVVED